MSLDPAIGDGYAGARMTSSGDVTRDVIKQSLARGCGRQDPNATQPSTARQPCKTSANHSTIQQPVSAAAAGGE